MGIKHVDPFVGQSQNLALVTSRWFKTGAETVKMQKSFQDLLALMGLIRCSAWVLYCTQRQYCNNALLFKEIPLYEFLNFQDMWQMYHEHYSVPSEPKQQIPYHCGHQWVIQVRQYISIFLCASNKLKAVIFHYSITLLVLQTGNLTLSFECKSKENKG